MSETHAVNVQSLLAPCMWTFYVSFIASYALTPVMSRLALTLGITDQPDGKRKLHCRTMPYLGGIAMFIAWLVGLLVHYIQQRAGNSGSSISFVTGAGIIGGAAAVTAVGLWDDAWRLKPLKKILGQILGASILLASGVGANSARPALVWIVTAGSSAFHLADPFAHGFPHWFAPLARIVSAGFTLMVVVGCCNAMNLMDGLDGLCGGISAIIMGGFLFLSVHLAASGAGQNDSLRVVLALAAMGAVLGFVPFNFSPAIIFMGDAGSMFLGYSCATLMVLMAEADGKWFLAALVIFALPVLDTSMAFVRRWIAGRPLFAADARHIHHQLMQKGLSVRRTVLVSYGLTAAFTVLGIAMVFIQCRFAVAFYLIVFSFIAVAAYKTGMLHEGTMPLQIRLRHPESDVLSPREINGLLQSTSDPNFRDLLEFVWATGCRGGDAVRIRAHHVDRHARCIRLPATGDPARPARVINLDDLTARRIERLISDRGQGPLFCDPAGGSWTPSSIASEFRQLNRKLGRRYSLALLRRSRATILALNQFGPTRSDVKNFNRSQVVAAASPTESGTAP